jgi:hypothetical protein
MAAASDRNRGMCVRDRRRGGGVRESIGARDTDDRTGRHEGDERDRFPSAVQESDDGDSLAAKCYGKVSISGRARWRPPR